MNFKDQINALRQTVAEHQAAISAANKQIAALAERRITECAHEFSPPVKGYEHEGGTCIHCGINEVHYAHVKR